MDGNCNINTEIVLVISYTIVIYLSICLSVCISIYLSICLSVAFLTNEF